MFKANQSNVKEKFKEILDKAESDLLESLTQHLQKVSNNYHLDIDTYLKNMSCACNEANASELIRHERFWSATKANIQREAERKHHTACNKINELTGRRKKFKSNEFYQLTQRSTIDWDRQTLESTTRSNRQTLESTTHSNSSSPPGTSPGRTR